MQRRRSARTIPCSPKYYGMGGRRRRPRFPVKLALTAVIAVAHAIASVVEWLSGRSEAASGTADVKCGAQASF